MSVAAERMVNDAARALGGILGDEAAAARIDELRGKFPEPAKLARILIAEIQHHRESDDEPPEAPKALVAAAPTTTASPTRKRRPSNRPGPVAAPAPYNLTGGWFRVSNDVVDKLLGSMPGPVAKAYVVACRYADVHGKLWCSYSGLARSIGCRDARHARRLMDRLRAAGLVQLIERGSAASRRANVYQLGLLDGLDLDAVKATLARPLDEHAARRRRANRGGAHP